MGPESMRTRIRGSEGTLSALFFDTYLWEVRTVRSWGRSGGSGAQIWALIGALGGRERDGTRPNTSYGYLD